jgi:hypothetical protein
MVEVENSVQLPTPICLYLNLSSVSMFAGKNNCLNAPMSITVSVCTSLCLHVTTTELFSVFFGIQFWGILRKSVDTVKF